MATSTWFSPVTLHVFQVDLEKGAEKEMNQKMEELERAKEKETDLMSPKTPRRVPGSHLPILKSNIYKTPQVILLLLIMVTFK